MYRGFGGKQKGGHQGPLEDDSQEAFALVHDVDIGDAHHDVEEGDQRDGGVDELLALLITHAVDHEQGHAQHQRGDEQDVVVDPRDQIPKPDQVGREGRENEPTGAEDEQSLADLPEVPLPECADEDAPEEKHGDQQAEQDAPSAAKQVKVAHDLESFLLRPLPDERCRVV